jgi:hypothetical protein
VKRQSLRHEKGGRAVVLGVRDGNGDLFVRIVGALLVLVVRGGGAPAAGEEALVEVAGLHGEREMRAWASGPARLSGRLGSYALRICWISFSNDFTFFYDLDIIILVAYLSAHKYI